MTDIPTRKRILDEIDLNEISIVDSPMVEPARVAILKRATLCKRVALTSATDEHAHSILTDDHQGGEARVGQTSYANDHSHDWIVDESGNIVIAEANGHAHEIAEFFKNLPEGSTLAGALDKGTIPAGTNTDTTMTDAEKAAIEKKAADDKKANELLQKRAERAEQIVFLSPEQRKYFDGLNGDAKDEFLVKSADEKSAVVKNAQDSDPVIYTATDGRTFRKSADSNLVAEVQRGDRQEKVIADGVKLQKRSAIEKRAAEELKHLTGEDAAKADLLEAVEALPVEKRSPVLAILKAQDAGIAAAMTRIGTTGGSDGDGNDAETKLDALAKKLAGEQKITEEAGMSAALKTPEGKELYGQL